MIWDTDYQNYDLAVQIGQNGEDKSPTESKTQSTIMQMEIVIYILFGV